jgi:hypothetical protein
MPRILHVLLDLALLPHMLALLASLSAVRLAAVSVRMPGH